MWYADRFKPTLPRFELILDTEEEPLTLSEVKIASRIDYVPEFSDGASEDTFLTTLIGVARRLAENVTRRALTPQVWKLILDDFPLSGRIELAFPPVWANSIRYRDATGEWQDLDAGVFILSGGDAPYLYLADGVSPPTVYSERESVEIIFQCGYHLPADVPSPIKQWMLLKIAELYENREASAVGNIRTLPFVAGLLERYKVRDIPYIEAYPYESR